MHTDAQKRMPPGTKLGIGLAALAVALAASLLVFTLAGRRGAPAFRLTATELRAAYERNALDAAAKYEGQLVEVTGTVHEVLQDRLRLWTDHPRAGRAPGVVCEIDPDRRATLAGSASGKSVSVVGRVDGLYRQPNGVPFVLLRDCRAAR